MHETEDANRPDLASQGPLFIDKLNANSFKPILSQVSTSKRCHAFELQFWAAHHDQIEFRRSHRSGDSETGAAYVLRPGVFLRDRAHAFVEVFDPNLLDLVLSIQPPAFVAAPLLGAEDRPGSLKESSRRVLADEFNAHPSHTLLWRLNSPNQSVDVIALVGESMVSKLGRQRQREI